MAVNKGYITVQEAADLSGYSVIHVRRLYHAGKIKGERVGERIIFIDKQSLLDYKAGDPHPGRPRIETDNLEG